MATRTNSKLSPKNAAPVKAMPVRGQRTATHASNMSVMAGQPAKPTKQQVQQEKKWQAQDDLRTLQRAAEVKADPARVKMAQSEAASQVKALSSVLKK